MDHYKLTDVIEVPELAPMPVIRSGRSEMLAKLFGIEKRLKRASQARAQTSDDGALVRSLIPSVNQITFLTGPSGAGKSSLLKLIRSSQVNLAWLDLNEIDLPDRPLVDCFGEAPLDQTLAILSQVGLAEAWSYLRTPGELSEGQRWRLKLAMGIREAQRVQTLVNAKSILRDSGLRPVPDRQDGPEARLTRMCEIHSPDKSNPPHRSARSILIADEFAAVLDRVSAAVVARCLRRMVSETSNLAAIVATSHEDLLRALSPDVMARCDFGEIQISQRKSSFSERESIG